MAETKQMYNDGSTQNGGKSATYGPAIRIDDKLRKILHDEEKDSIGVENIGGTVRLQKNNGKNIIGYRVYNILDDKNTGDGGTNGEGAVSCYKATIALKLKTTLPDGATNIEFISQKHKVTPGLIYIVGIGATEAESKTKLETRIVEELYSKFEWIRADLEAGACIGADMKVAKAYKLSGAGTDANTVVDKYFTNMLINDGKAEPIVVSGHGNLFGSSGDINKIKQSIPLLPEDAGDINNLSFKRTQIGGEIHEIGFKIPFTKAMMEYDDQESLITDMFTNGVRAMKELKDKYATITVVEAAEIVRFGGDALSMSEIDPTCILSYKSLHRTKLALNKNKCPMNTTINSGSTIADSKAINAARIMFVHPYLELTFRGMTDLSGKNIFVPVEQYASNQVVLTGEIGTVQGFKIVVKQEMVYHAAAGALVTDATEMKGFAASYNEANELRYDVFPCVVVGEKAFKKIQFSMSGAGNDAKTFEVNTFMPDLSLDDPYKKRGFMSFLAKIGMVFERPDHIAVINVAAQY